MRNVAILISDESDFVPAEKLARRKRIEFILVKPDLQEHIDDLNITLSK